VKKSLRKLSSILLLYIALFLMAQEGIASNSTWQRTFDSKDSDIAYSVQQTIDGGFIIVGITTSFGAGKEAMYIMYILKFDANGNTGPYPTSKEIE